jgi:hypothetical protein
MLRPSEQWLDEDLCIEPRYGSANTKMVAYRRLRTRVGLALFKKRSDQGQMAIWGLFMATKASAWANGNTLSPQKPKGEFASKNCSNMF